MRSGTPSWWLFENDGRIGWRTGGTGTVRVSERRRARVEIELPVNAGVRRDVEPMVPPQVGDASGGGGLQLWSEGQPIADADVGPVQQLGDQRRGEVHRVMDDDVGVDVARRRQLVVEPGDETLTGKHAPDEKRALLGRRPRRELWCCGDRPHPRRDGILAGHPQRETIDSGTIESLPGHERDVMTSVLQRSCDANHRDVMTKRRNARTQHLHDHLPLFLGGQYVDRSPGSRPDHPSPSPNDWTKPSRTPDASLRRLVAGRPRSLVVASEVARRSRSGLPLPGSPPSPLGDRR